MQVKALMEKSVTRRSEDVTFVALDPTVYVRNSAWVVLTAWTHPITVRCMSPPDDLDAHLIPIQMLNSRTNGKNNAIIHCRFEETVRSIFVIKPY